MRRIALLVLLLVLASAAPAEAQDTRSTPAWCNKFFQVSQGAVSIVKIISGIAGQSISLCGWALNAGAAAATATLAYGTGTNCNTGAATIFPVTALGINGVFVNHTDFANISPPSVNASGVANDICLTTTGTGPMAIVIYYTQF